MIEDRREERSYTTAYIIYHIGGRVYECMEEPMLDVLVSDEFETKTLPWYDNPSFGIEFKYIKTTS